MEVMDQMEAHRLFLDAAGLTSDPEIPGVMDESELYQAYMEAVRLAQEGHESEPPEE